MGIKNKKTLNPHVLVLEGLWGDTAIALAAAGALTQEEAPWDYVGVEDEMLSGKYDGLVLTGGSDINPAIYNQNAHAEVYGIDTLRDSVELMALRIARQQGIPVMGICRGSQIMCAYRGGCLTQHIERHRGGEHAVVAAPDARTFKRACNSRDMHVVSLHHQCIDNPGPGMRIAAYAHDGTPEAIESKDGLWLGVQFHPEINAFENGNSFAIFQWLVSKAAEHAGGRAPVVRFRDAKQARRAEITRERSYRDVLAAERKAAQATEITTDARQPWAPRKSRQAGDRSLPSMREMTDVIVDSLSKNGRTFSVFADGTAEEVEYEGNDGLVVCPDCALLFDDIDDRDDHVLYVHGRESYITARQEKWPEPPEGHPAWNMH